MQLSLPSLLCAAGLSAAIISSTVSAHAQDEVTTYPKCESGPSESDVSAAKGAYEAGQVSFQEADYDRALLYWEDAFRRDCTAVKLLLNIARAYELSGNRKAAVNALQTYVDRRPDASDRASVEKRIGKLNEKIEEAEAKAAPAPEVDETDSEGPDEDGTEAPAAATTDVEEAPSDRPIWPIVVTGSGAGVSLLGLLVVAAGNQSAEDRRNEIAAAYGCTQSSRQWACPDNASRDNVERQADEDDELKSANTTMGVGVGVAIIGLATAGVGGYYWYTTWKNNENEIAKSRFTPVVSPGYQGVQFSTTF